LVFLDEPTSGLDSYSAVQLCQVLKKVANAGASVLFTIHQPSSDIFKSFDNLILMNKGRVMYQGPVEEVPAFFAACSNPVPPNYNPADWIMVRLNFMRTYHERCCYFLGISARLCHRILPNRYQ
jgi:ABC-type multidrug transport system ATPase subunit